MAERENIRSRLKKHQLTQVWLINQLGLRGIVTDKTEMSSVLAGTRSGSKADAIIELSHDILDKYEEGSTLKIIQLNTDGIMVSFDKSDEAKWQEITQEWQDRTGFELEEDFIQKIVQRDVNNYVEVPVGDGKPKVKGGNLVRGILTNANIDFTTMGLPAWDNMSGGAWNINNNACIVATAMKEYFVNGTLPEETIAASNNILDFQVIAKVGGKYSGCYQLIGGEKVPVQKVNRVYACKNKGYGKIYKTHATTGKDAKVPSLPDHCIVDNNNELSIDVVDREWYVKLAKEQIRKFLGVKAPRKNTRKINSLQIVSVRWQARLSCVFT